MIIKGNYGLVEVRNRLMTLEIIEIRKKTLPYSVRHIDLIIPGVDSDLVLLILSF